ELDLAAGFAEAVAQLRRRPQRRQVEGQGLIPAAGNDPHLRCLRGAMVARDKLLNPEGLSAQVEVVRALPDASLHDRFPARRIGPGEIEQDARLGSELLQGIEV